MPASSYHKHRCKRVIRANGPNRFRVIDGLKVPRVGPVCSTFLILSLIQRLCLRILEIEIDMCIKRSVWRWSRSHNAKCTFDVVHMQRRRQEIKPTDKTVNTELSISDHWNCPAYVVLVFRARIINNQKTVSDPYQCNVLCQNCHIIIFYLTNRPQSRTSQAN